jgi:hypothetical protein
MKTHVLSLVGLLVCPFLFSQILTVNAGSSVSIASGSSVSLGGLEIAPAETYVISVPMMFLVPLLLLLQDPIALCLVYIAHLL